MSSLLCAHAATDSSPVFPHSLSDLWREQSSGWYKCTRVYHPVWGKRSNQLWLWFSVQHPGICINIIMIICQCKVGTVAYDLDIVYGLVLISSCLVPSMWSLKHPLNKCKATSWNRFVLFFIWLSVKCRPLYDFSTIFPFLFSSSLFALGLAMLGLVFITSYTSAQCT